MKLLAYGLLLVFTMSGMKKCDTPVDGKMVKLGDTFELKVDETIMIEGEKVGITFVKNQESRCPLNVNCMRAGEAKTTIKLTNESGSKEVVLESKGNCQEMDGSCGEMKKSMGYSVKLINVSPYPGSDAANKKEAVTAKLQVTK